MAFAQQPLDENQRLVSNSNHDGKNNNSNNGVQLASQQQQTTKQSPRASILMLSQWIDTCAAGLFSTCENAGQTAWTTTVRNEPLHTLDYSQLHDHFLESLLQEAANPPSHNNNNQNSDKKKQSTDAYQQSPGIPDDSDSSVLSSSNQSHSRRRRLPRLRNKQRDNTDTSGHEQSDGDSSHNNNNKLSQPSKLARQLSKLPPGQPYDPNDPMPLLPHHFLHDHVRMQKDKGRGEEPGSLICAKGQDACLDKLRAKMQLLCNTAIQEKGASMKRRPARVSIHLDNFVETRSILEVRLGFLSMMYGILLRWDTNITGKITLVVLRKMCHESFYPAAPAAAVPPHLISASTSGSSAEEDGEELTGEGGSVNNNNLQRKRSSPRVVEGKAIVDWPDGTEVTIIEPPYLIPRPDKFKPTIMAVSSLYATGLDRKTSWMVQFELQNVPEVTSLNLTYDSTRKHFVPRVQGSSSNWKGITYEVESLDAILDVKLYQVKVRNRKKKLIGTMQVPLANLPVQKDPPTHLSIPCQEATLDLDIYLESESLEWTQNELEARRKASSFFWPRSSARSSRFSLLSSSPRKGSVSRSPLKNSLRHSATPPPPMIGVVDTDDDEEDDDDAWGWILCYMC